MFNIPEYPWFTNSRPGDHDTINPILLKHITGRFWRIHIPVSNYRDPYEWIIFNFPDKGPVGFSFVKLYSCSAMNSYCADTCILQSQSHIHYVFIHVIPTQTRFYCNRQISRFYYSFSHPDHQGDIFQHTCSRTTSRDFFNRTTVIYINEIGFCCFSDFGCLYHGFNIVPVKLNTYGTFLIADFKFPDTLLPFPDKTIG